MRSVEELIERGNYWITRMREDGFPIAPDLKVQYEPVQKSCFAYIRRKGGHAIHLMPAMQEINMDILDNTIIHEIIHSCPNCWSHGIHFKVQGIKATSKYKLKYPIATNGDVVESQELFKTRAYLEKAKLIIVSLETGRVNVSFKSKGTKLHYLVDCMIRGVNLFSEKTVVIKNRGVNLFQPIFSNNVTDEDIARFNEKFASQGCAAYPMLQRRNSEISVAPEIRPCPIPHPSEEERVAAKSPKPIEVYTGSQQLSLF